MGLGTKPSTTKGSGGFSGLLRSKLSRAGGDESATVGSRVRSLLRSSSRADDSANYGELYSIMDKYWKYTMKANPEYATILGNHEYDHQLSEKSVESNEKEIVFLETMLRSLDRLFPDRVSSLQGWSPDEKTTYFHFRSKLEDRLLEAKDKRILSPVNNKFSPHAMLQMVFSKMRYRNVEDFEIFNKRISQIPKYLNEVENLMRIGLSEGMSPAKVATTAVPDQIKAFVEMNKKPDGPVRAPLAKFDEVCKGPDAAALKESISSNIDKCIVEPFIAFGKFVEEEYIPQLKEEVSFSRRVKNGAEIYAHACQIHTTTKLTPAEIHEIGLKEVERIRGEMIEVANSEGYSGDNAIDEYAEYLLKSEEFIPKSTEEMLKVYRACCMEVLPELPRLFGKLPRTTFGVRAIPDFIASSAAGAYYQPPSSDGSQPGWFNVNCSHLDMRKLYDVESLVLHEAVPGHHMQIALQMENTDLPDFRKYTFSTAYVEGWGLYSESLGKELGLYKKPSSYFGRLGNEMLRACRLVVDTGMHHHGWTKQKAMEFMRVNKAGTEKEIDSETTRYVCNPGQALAYKIGEMKILELRKRATETLGDKFDIREFHDVVLAVGGVSLAALEEVVDNWIAEILR